MKRGGNLPLLKHPQHHPQPQQRRKQNRDRQHDVNFEIRAPGDADALLGEDMEPDESGE